MLRSALAFYIQTCQRNAFLQTVVGRSERGEALVVFKLSPLASEILAGSVQHPQLRVSRDGQARDGIGAHSPGEPQR